MKHGLKPKVLQSAIPDDFFKMLISDQLYNSQVLLKSIKVL